MNRLMALLKREYWENQGAFRTTPLVVGGIYIVLTLMFLITFSHFDNEFQSLKELTRFLSQTDVGLRSEVIYGVAVAIFLLPMTLTSLFLTVVLRLEQPAEHLPYTAAF